MDGLLFTLIKVRTLIKFRNGFCKGVQYPANAVLKFKMGL